MTTVHTGDRTSGCDICSKNDYLNEIIEANNWSMCADTYEGALSAWVDNSPTYYKWEEWENWISDFEEAYSGEWNSEAEFAEDLAVNTGLLDGVPDHIQIYFDWDKWTRDLFISDYWSSNGYIFRNF
jgi:antirestriction protein